MTALLPLARYFGAEAERRASFVRSAWLRAAALILFAFAFLVISDAAAAEDLYQEIGSARWVHYGDNGLGAEASPPEVRTEQEAAERGSAEMAFRISQRFEYGRGLARSGPETLKWLLKASDLGSSRAKVRLAVAYLSGEFGLPVDDQKAASLLREASESGDPFAQLNLGLAYRLGTGVPRDFKLAQNWLRKYLSHPGAAEDSYAHLILGITYWAGFDGARSPELAEQHFAIAARLGDPLAQQLLEERSLLRPLAPVDAEKFGFLAPLTQTSLRDLAGSTFIYPAVREGENVVTWNGVRHRFTSAGSGDYTCISNGQPCSGKFKIDSSDLYYLPSDASRVHKFRFYPAGILAKSLVKDGRRQTLLLLTDAGFNDTQVRAFAEQIDKANAAAAAQEADAEQPLPAAS